MDAGSDIIGHKPVAVEGAIPPRLGAWIRGVIQQWDGAAKCVDEHVQRTQTCGRGRCDCPRFRAGFRVWNGPLWRQIGDDSGRKRGGAKVCRPERSTAHKPVG